MAAAAQDSRSGELLNKSYELHELLESGGVADTYRATDRKRSRSVKVTLLRPEFALQSGVVQSFLRLPKTLTGLRHPNVSQVIAVESDETGIPFVVEEYVEGDSLARTVATFSGGMPIGVAMNLLSPVVDAMAAAHKLGLVHGQLDQEHVVLARSGGTSVPKIVRFGAAALRAKQQPKGSDQRTAPELRSGKGAADARSDVWALGALLYETLCGEAPASASGAHTPLDEHAPHLPTELVQLVESCLAPEPGRRPKQAEDVRVALSGVRERLRVGGTAPVEARAGKSAGAVQAEPRARKSVAHDPRAASMPPRAPAKVAAPARSAPKLPALTEVAREPERRVAPAARALTPSFAPEAEITFGEPSEQAAPEAEVDPFADFAEPPRSPSLPAKAQAKAKSVKPVPKPAASPQRTPGRKTVAGREVALPTLGDAADSGFDDAFAATFDDAFADEPKARDALDLMPPPLPPPPKTKSDDAAARAFGLGATMMQPAPTAGAKAAFPRADDEARVFALPGVTTPDDYEPEMTLEPATPSMPAPRARKSGAPEQVDVKTMSDVAAAFGPIEGGDHIGQGETDASARGREFRKKLEESAPVATKKGFARKHRDGDGERKSNAGERPSRASGEARMPPPAPLRSPKQLRQANAPISKLSEDQARMLQQRVQAGERRRWRVFGNLLMLLFCFALVFFVPMLYDPTRTKAQAQFGTHLKIVLPVLMIVSIAALVRTWVLQVQSRPMMLRPVTLTMKVVTLCVCVLSASYFLPFGALGPAEAAARFALPWASGGFYMFLGIYGLMQGVRETANNMLYGAALVLLYGAGFGGAYRSLSETVLHKRLHGQKAGLEMGAANAAGTAEALAKYTSGKVQAVDAGTAEPMVQQHEVGGSEEEDMKSIEQLRSGRKDKGEKFDQLHKNMEKLAH